MSQAPLTTNDFVTAVTAVSAAFGDPTRRDIFLFADEREGVTAGDTAKHFDLHANVARHHLDKLAAGGYLAVTVERGAGAGRPSKYYRPTGDAAFELPLRHDDILLALLGRALQELGTTRAEALAESVGADLGQRLSDSLGGDATHQSFGAALHTVAEALTAHGFAAHAEHDKGELRIVSDHCPFGPTPIEHPVICAVDRGFVTGMLKGLGSEASAELSESLPMGDAHCVTTVTE
ncbi:MAG: helix-turn-helix domain-containing protein [Acidobacteria bacterium]|nr:helix-turn-helix domain-containing protein [Acidobacteriota bacterium]